MGKETRPSARRLTQILERQDPPGFGANYRTAIKASREEAPANSRPAWVWWEKGQRELSTLSAVERSVLLICLYQPRLWEVYDQYMLPMWPRAHPLAGHPKAAGLILPGMRGTLEVAEILGVLKFHARVKVPVADDSEETEDAPFPWIGDFLLFLEDEQGPYCVNLDIKDSAEHFERPLPRVRGGTKALQRAEEKTRARHAVEDAVLGDAGIPTIRLTRADFSKDVVAALTALYLWHKRRAPFDADQRIEIVDNFKAALVTGVPPVETMFGLAARYGWTRYDLSIVLHQAIWQREIRIDLFQPLLLDQPMLPEKQDVLSIYGHWFKRPT